MPKRTSRAMHAKGKNHGGRRPGAGRPPLCEENRKRVNITITDREHQRARWLGEGNVSLGIARALLTCPDWARKVE